jgi:hypothetical protein
MPAWFERLANQDRLLAVIAIASALLLVIALFFALLTIGLRLRSLRREIVRTRLEQLWEPLILSALTGDATIGDVHRAIAPRDALFFVSYLLRFVNRFVGDERRVLRQLAEPYLPRVAAQLRSSRAEARARAVQTLLLLGESAYDREVVSALDDESLTVAMVAARALALAEHTRFAPEILRRIHRFRHWNPLYLSSLFSSMGTDVVPALRSIYSDPDADPLVRRVAADALHDLDDVGSAGTAQDIASSDAATELVAASIRLLGRVGSAEHADVARWALLSDNPLLRLRGAEALGELGGPEDLLRLRSAIDDPSPWVALAAARALGRSGGRDMLASLQAEDGPRGMLAREVLGGAGAAL